jgi:hypothetical protein
MKREPSAQGVSLGDLVPGGYKYEDLPLQVGGSLKWDSKIWLWVLQDLDLRVTALVTPRSSCTSKLQNHPLIREGAQHEETHNCHTEKKNLVIVSSRWKPDTKTHCLTDSPLQLNFNFKRDSQLLDRVPVSQEVWSTDRILNMEYEVIIYIEYLTLILRCLPKLEDCKIVKCVAVTGKWDT